MSNWFGFGNAAVESDELPEIFPFGTLKKDFITIDVVSIYSKILIDVAERTHGMSEEHEALLWDNCLQSESNRGLITLLACAMTDKADLFLVFKEKVLRIADNTEAAQIRADYKALGESKNGVFISFRNYIKSDMLKIFSALEFCTVSSLHKSANLSTAIQLKFTDLRGAVSLSDSDDIKTKGMTIARALSRGKDVMLDAKDEITTSTPDLKAVEESVEFLNEKRAFYLGMPAAYICGEQTGGIGSTGEGDTKAIERGLKNYYSSIFKPAVEALFGSNLTYKSQDFRQIASALEALKTFSLVDESLISNDVKKKIIEGLLDVDESDNITKEPEPPPDPGVPAPVPGDKTKPPPPPKV